MVKKVLTVRQQFWLTHIQAAMKSGEQLQGYAKRHGLSLAGLYNAKSVLKRAGLLKSASSSGRMGRERCMAKKAITKRQQFWLTHIRTAMKSGEQLQRYAHRHGLSVAGLYNAKSVLKRSGLLKSASSELTASAFVPVQIAPQAQPSIRCRLQHFSGWQLEMERLPDAKWLRDVIGSDRDAST